ncbi:3-hydroxybutyryl-CoA dehydrogenase [Paenibacillus sp. NPDC058174]|uniref:3-hydroxybutyryl-CoA dehydrogenase n=1 Tax=Paenibacillus sp. NPDC058174 TaxID=3346366 RepID=UPI0036D91FC8
MNISRIGVIGAGQMGGGIAQVFAVHSFSVTLYDIDMQLAGRGYAAIEASLKRLVGKGRLTEEAAALTLERLSPTADLAQLRDAELVIEAAPERLDLKKRLFAELDQLCGQHTILATNTSSLPVTELAAATSRAHRVIGMHFMNPVPVMPLVEVIRGLATSEETFDTIVAITQAIGKTAVPVRDYPGFVSNRVLMPMINEAIYAVYEGVAAPEGIDQIMQLGMNHPMGPLKLADFIGLDTCLAIMETLHQGFGDSKYRPCPLLRSYVQAGWLGKKTGRGFYTYS